MIILFQLKVCHARCSSCSANATDCEVCKGNFRNNTPPTCSCLKGYFEKSQVSDCQLCDKNCLTCVDTANKCVTCRGDRINPPTCGCPAGKFDDFNQENCTSCYYTCATCSVLEDNCTACAGNRNLTAANKCICLDKLYDFGCSLDFGCVKWCGSNNNFL